MNKRSEHKSESKTKDLSLSGEKNVSIPLRNLVSIIACAALAGSAYWNLSSSVTRLQTAVSDIITELEKRKDWAYEDPVARIWRLEAAIDLIEERIKNQPPNKL